MEAIEAPVHAVGEKVREVEQAYGEDRPLREFAGLMGVYSTLVVVLSLVASRKGRLGRGSTAADVVLFGVATHKLSRILAKDPITSPIRAPFTRLEGTSGPAELREEVRGDGWRHAVGELLTCPFCLGQWIATFFVFGAMFLPRFTRAVAAMFAAHAVSDALQFGYAALERTEG
jgi:hypothetical protein